MSYFRMTFRHTIIGAAAFHGRVRNGNGWFHRAKITRGLSYALAHSAGLWGPFSCWANRSWEAGGNIAAHWQLHTGKLRTRI